ncbi:MAG: hypothetical protein PVJ86_08395 [Phycisphaerales bacterium]|jgi:hypothetical protein
MMWCDITGNTNAGGHGSTSDHMFTESGHFEATDGRHAEWHLKTGDGTVATCTINDRRYNGV